MSAGARGNNNGTRAGGEQAITRQEIRALQTAVRGIPSKVPKAGVPDAVVISATKVAHGFIVGTLVYATTTGWFASNTNAVSSARYDGMVSRVTGTDTFEVTLIGLVARAGGSGTHYPGAGFLQGAIYYLSGPSGVAVTQNLSALPADHLRVPAFIALSPTVACVFAASRTDENLEAKLVVRFNVTNTGATDLTEGELLDSAGAASGVLVWVDGLAALATLRPSFGTPRFYGRSHGMVSRSGSLRPLYRLTRQDHATGLTGKAACFIFTANSSANVQDPTAGTNYSATIAGVAYDHSVPIRIPDLTIAAAGYRWSAFDLKYCGPFLIADAGWNPTGTYLSQALRAGMASAVSGGGTTASPTGLLIDPGEVFRVDIYASGFSSPGGHANSLTNRIHVAAYFGRNTVSGISTGGIVAQTSLKFTEQQANAGNGFWPIDSANSSVNGFTNASGVTVTFTVTFTLNAYSQITGITVTASSACDFSALLTGGARNY